MTNSLILSHLPSSLAYHESLAFIRERKQVPEAAELEAALVAGGLDSRLVRESFLTAQRESERSGRRLGKPLSISTYWCRDYPASLRPLARPPWNLFYLGKLPRQSPTLAVVGTRRPDEYGVRLVREFIPRLNVEGLQLVSGLAYGIDALAHEQACACELANFAVLGSGPDILYPASHAELASRIVAGGGGILSELPPGTEPAQRNFPRRNRIISGLADVIWVVQGAARSGSYHTAKHALDQQKTIVACPGDLFADLSQIPNRLLFDGAQMILGPNDLASLFRQQMPMKGIA